MSRSFLYLVKINLLQGILYGALRAMRRVEVDLQLQFIK
jgi:hypothetical protein